MQGTCIIICAGDMNISQIDIKKEDYIIAADGGFLYCKLLEIVPNLIVGDFDSLTEDVEEEIERLESECSERIQRYPAEKDDTDTLIAVKEGLKRGYRHFKIYAGVGGRIEHTIANMQLLVYLKNHGASGYLMDAEFMGLIVQNEEVSFQKEMKGFLSLFSIGEKAVGVTIKGMKYCIENAVVSNDFPIGISNEFIGEKGSILVEKGCLLVIVRWL